MSVPARSSRQDPTARRSAAPSSAEHAEQASSAASSVKVAASGVAWASAVLGNGVLQRSFEGAELGGLGAFVVQEQAMDASGAHSEGATANSVMRRVLRRESLPLGPVEAQHLRQARSQSGSALQPEQLRRFERAFGHDFGHVRIHADGASAQAAKALSAHAFALGADLFFSAGSYAPGTPAGDRLLAHELTHVVQHDEGRLPGGTAGGEGQEVSSPSDPHELEAYRNESVIVGMLDSPGPAVGEVASGGGAAADGGAVARSEDAGAAPVTETATEEEGAEEEGAEEDGSGVVPVRERILDSAGEPLDERVVRAVSDLVGADVGHVIVHRDAVAREVGERVGREVYSIGHHLFVTREDALDGALDGAVRAELEHIAEGEASGDEEELERALDGGGVAPRPGADAESQRGLTDGVPVGEANQGDARTEDPDHLPGVTDRAAPSAETMGEDEEKDEEDREEEDEEKEEEGEEREGHGKEDEDGEASEEPATSEVLEHDAAGLDAEVPPAFATLTQDALAGYAQEKAIHEAWAEQTGPGGIEETPELPDAGSFFGSAMQGVGDGVEISVMQMALGQVGIGMGPSGRPSMNLKAGEGLAGGKNFAGGFMVLGHMAMVGPEQWFNDMGAATIGKGREGVDKLFGEDSDLITRIAGFIDIADAINNAILYAGYIAQAIAAVCFALAAALSSNPFTAGLAPAMLAIANFAVTVGDMLLTVNTVFGMVIMGLRAIHVIAQALRLAIEDADPATQAERVTALQESIGGLANEVTQRAVLGAAGGGDLAEFGTADNHTAAFKDKAIEMMDEVAAGGAATEAPAPAELQVPEGVELPPPPVEQEQAIDVASVAIARIDAEKAQTELMSSGLAETEEQVSFEQRRLQENEALIQHHQQAAEAQLAELTEKEAAAQQGQETAEEIVDEGLQTQGTAHEMFGLMGSAVNMLLSLFGMAPSDAGDTSADTEGMQGGAQSGVDSADPVPTAGEEGQGAVQTTQDEIAQTTEGTVQGQASMQVVQERILAEQEANQIQQATVADTSSHAEEHVEALEAARAELVERHAEAVDTLQTWAAEHEAARALDDEASALGADAFG